MNVLGGDVFDLALVEQAVAGQDAVLSTLGVPFSREPITMYSRGMAHLMQAMNHAGVRRVICVSSSAARGVQGAEQKLRNRKRAPCILKKANMMDLWMLIAKVLVSLVAITTALGGALADLVIPATAKQHMHNANWPPQLFLLCVLLAILIGSEILAFL